MNLTMKPKAKKKVVKRKPQDATLRNIRAFKKRLEIIADVPMREIANIKRDHDFYARATSNLLGDHCRFISNIFARLNLLEEKTK